MKKRIILSLFAAAIAPAMTHASLLEQVNTTGSGAGGHTAIQTAVNAVSDGGVVEIIEAATYVGTVTIPGGKSFTIRGTVPGVISENPAASGMWSVPFSTDTGYVAGAVNVTVENMTMRRVDGTGPVLDIGQRTTLDGTVSVTMNNVTVVHTLVGAGGEAVKIDEGVQSPSTGATMNFTATGCSFTSNTVVPASGKSAIRVQSKNANIDNLNVNLTNCTLNAQNEGAIRIDNFSNTTVGPINNHNWTLTGCTITSADRGFEVDDSMTNCTINMTNTSITTNGSVSAIDEAILFNDDGSNNTIALRRCTFDNSLATTAPAQCVRFDFNTATPGTGNAVTAYNCLFVTHLAATGICVAMDAVGTSPASPAVFDHCTFVQAGSGAGLGRGLSSSASGAYDFSNCLFLNCGDPIVGTTATFAAEVTKTRNVIVGPADDTSAGTDRSFTTAADFAASCTAAKVNSTTFIPLTAVDSSPGSVVNGFGSIAVGTTVGNVDRRNRARPTGAARPDSGAFEVDETAAPVSDWLILNN